MQQKLCPGITSGLQVCQEQSLSIARCGPKPEIRLHCGTPGAMSPCEEVLPVPAGARESQQGTGMLVRSGVIPADAAKNRAFACLGNTGGRVHAALFLH